MWKVDLPTQSFQIVTQISETRTESNSSLRDKIVGTVQCIHCYFKCSDFKSTFAALTPQGRLPSLPRVPFSGVPDDNRELPPYLSVTFHSFLQHFIRLAITLILQSCHADSTQRRARGQVTRAVREKCVFAFVFVHKQFGPFFGTVNTVSLEGWEWIRFSHAQKFVELVQQNIVFASSFLEIHEKISWKISRAGTPRKLNVVQLPSVSARTKADRKRSD